MQLMLSYCMHVTFYLLLKTEGKPVKGHPVLDRLVELRVYLEKIRPLEEKLQYTLNKLLSSTSIGVNVSGLRPVERDDGGIYRPARAGHDDEGKKRRLERKAQREAETLEREEEATMTRFRKKTVVPSLDKIRAADEGYQEDADQFFSKLVGDYDDDGDDAGLSLIEKLRKRQESKSLRTAAPKAERADSDDGEEDEADLLGDGGSDYDYDALVEEEEEREEHKQRTQSMRVPRKEYADVQRRKINKNIEAHRGLTKARPKDRKTPRTAQRRKFERGMQKVKSQSKTVQAEPDQGFVGVRALRPNVTHSTKFK